MEIKYSKELTSRMQKYMKKRCNVDFSIEESGAFLDSLADLFLLFRKSYKDKKAKIKCFLKKH